MFCISVSYKKTPAGIRQKFAFLPGEQYCFTRELVNSGIITGGVILSTCNRSEIYFSGPGSSVEKVAGKLSDFKNIKDCDIKKHCLFYGGKSAVKHLFKVVSGLDSMVLGEDEILRQVKEAYLAFAGKKYTDSELNIIFQDALNCAKTGKSETRLSTTPVSVGTITANTVEKYLASAAFPAKKVMVIGITGKTGTIVAKNLISKGIPVIGTSRKRHTGDFLYFPGEGQAEIIDFQDRYLYIDNTAAVISATSSPHYTVTYREYLESVTESRERLLVDLAVPYDIDREIASINGVKLLDIDYFNTLSRDNVNIRLSEMDKVESILSVCVENTMKKIYIRDFINRVKENAALNKKYKEEKWFSKMVYYLKDVLGSGELKETLDKVYKNETDGADIR